MASPMQESKKNEAIKKGAVAAVAAAGGVAVAVAGFPVTGAIGIGAGAFLGYRWLRYRIENGLRF